MNILIVGAGLYGAVCAERLTSFGHQCTVMEKRNHIAGNIYTKLNVETGIQEHVYGAHIFHTNSEKIWNYINQFATFNNYVNRVKVNYKEKLYSFPINLFTLYQVFDVQTPDEAKKKINEELVKIESPSNVEDYCLSTIGPTLYHLFIEGYTQKQWNKHPKELPVDIIKRLPLRFTHDDNYYNSQYQGIPIGGYTSIIEKMLNNSKVILGVDFLKEKNNLVDKYDLVIYTGSIDAYFDYKFGELEYRSVRFETEVLDKQDYQGNAVINYTDINVPFTRIIEHKHFEMNLKSNKTLISREYPDNYVRGQIEYYPINDSKNNLLFDRYQKESIKLKDKVHFGGRLAEYKYYDMHQVIGSALSFCKKITNQ